MIRMENMCIVSCKSCPVLHFLECNRVWKNYSPIVPVLRCLFECLKDIKECSCHMKSILFRNNSATYFVCSFFVTI